MKVFLILSLTFFLVGCSKTNTSSQPPALTEKHNTLIKASNEFSFDLYKNSLVGEEKDKNVILSPLSVSMALSMVLNGTNGQSTSDLLNTLRLNTSIEDNNKVCADLLAYLPKADPKVSVNIGNSIWARNGFPLLEIFVSNLKTSFNAEANSLDFSNSSQAKSIINGWVEKATNGKIKTIVEEIKTDHVLFIINAVYFNAPWTKEFDIKKTIKSQFKLVNGGNKEIDMMHSNEIIFKHYSTVDFEMIELPYGNGQYTMTAIMPNEVSKFSNFEATLSYKKFDEWRAQLREVTRYDLYFPKFELDYKVNLNKPLAAMGMANLFSNSADLSKITNATNLKVSEVEHKTYMKVNEQGTEAAAVTSVGFVPTSEPPSVSFNKPFFLFITEKKSEAILFSGRIVKP